MGARTVSADDLAPGHRVQLGTHTISEDELVRFAGEWDPQWFHTDAEAAANGHFGGLIASGIHTLAVYQKLCVAEIYSTWDVLAGRGFDSLRFVAPVRPDDTLTGWIEVTEVLPRNDRYASVTTSVDLRNQSDETVLAGDMTVMVWRRGANPAPAGPAPAGPASAGPSPSSHAPAE